MYYMEVLNINEENVTNLANKIKSGVYSRHELLLVSIRKFFYEKENQEKFLPIVNGSSKISLRLIDWFVTNYSKKNNVMVDTNINDKPQKKIVHLDYKAQLKAYSKRWFDPFCRRERINFKYSDTEELITTVGQLNFFRWFIENDYLNFVEQNREIIEKDMNVSIKQNQKTTKREKTVKKEPALSVSGVKSVNKHNVKIIIDFS